MDGLAGKSRWLRKAPLELRHPHRPLLDGRPAVLLFAGGSAAKEQWYSALARGAAEGLHSKQGIEPKQDGGGGGAGAAVASVEALYTAFCARARELAAVPYPQVQQPSARAMLSRIHRDRAWAAGLGAGHVAWPAGEP